MAEDDTVKSGGESHQGPIEDFDVQQRQHQSDLRAIPEGAELEDNEEDAMVGPVLPKARKRRVSGRWADIMLALKSSSARLQQILLDQLA